jgi:magnesium transporter
MSNERCQLYEYSKSGYVVTYNVPSYFSETFSLDSLKKEKNYWLNFHSILCKEEITKICQNLGIDSLTIEDIYRLQKRPKLEEYPSYIFFSLKSAQYKDGFTLLIKENISFILGDNYLISIQEKSSDHFTEVRERIEKKKGKIREKGPEYLIFRMLEAITENYFEVIDQISAEIGRIEKKVKTANSDILEEIEINKRRLIELKKNAVPIKEITSQLEKLDCHFIDLENNRYFSDLKDSCQSILEEIEASKQILDGMSNLFYAAQGQKMNEIMKLLTLVSTVFIPLTFIAGIYGMNFEYMPELKWRYGYFAVWAAIAVVTALLLAFFRRKGWMKSS